MSSAMDLTNDNFDSTVGSGVTLVDFWAEWCGPCKMMTPVIDELASEFGDKVTVAKIDVDSQQELATKFQVSSIPTIIVFKDGEIEAGQGDQATSHRPGWKAAIHRGKNRQGDPLR